MKKYKFWSQADYKRHGGPRGGWIAGMNHLFDEPVTQEFFELIKRVGSKRLDSDELKNVILSAGGTIDREEDYDWHVSSDMLVSYTEKSSPASTATKKQTAKSSFNSEQSDLLLLLI